MAGYLNFQDMFNGGGAGSAGNEFEDGPLSALLNALGIRPAGYADRQSQATTASTSGPRGRPSLPGAVPPQPPALGPFGTAPGVMDPITTTPLPPQGVMPTEELLALLRQTLMQPPPATGYGPR